MISETLFAGMLVFEFGFRRAWGFIEGDCRTVRAGLRWEAFDVFLRDLRPVFGIIDCRFGSIFISIGEVVSDVSDPGMAPYTERWEA